jgi:peptidyl-prolyl cis-trans isomerase SurA
MRVSTQCYPLTGSVVVAAVVAVLAGCSPKEHDAVVASVGTRAIHLSEFRQQYEKSLGSDSSASESSQEDREKFLDLLVNYHLKLASAYAEGIDKRPDILSELNAYKGTLAQSYLTEREIVAPAIRRMYDRQGEEIRASHILLSLTPNASPADSAKAYAKAYDIIKQLKEGKDFSELALKYSMDPSVKSNKGDLYYFTAGQLVQPFEDSAYALQPGQFSSAPVRTKFGLHIIKVTDRKPTRGEVRAAHIMIRFPSPSPSPEDTLKAHQKISLIRDSLTAGVDFGALAQRNSEDPGSASKGGDLGYFGRRRWVQPFDEVALSMNPGEVSGIVRTPYGYHLIKCIDVRPRKSFEDSRKELEQVYRQQYFAADNAKFISDLKQELHFTRNDSAITLLYSALDSTKTTRDSAWWAAIPPAVGKSTLFTIEGQNISADSVITLLRGLSEATAIPLRRSGLESEIDKVADQLLFSAKATLLEGQLPEFKALMKEYFEGILLYQVEQENVWNKLVVTDSALADYFQSHRSSFAWPDRVDFSEIRASNDSLAWKIHSMLAIGKTMEEIATEDSVRLAALRSYRVSYSTGSRSLDRNAKNALKNFAEELRKYPLERLSIFCRPDTSLDGPAIMNLMRTRLENLNRYITQTLHIDSARVTSSLVAFPKGARVADTALVHGIDVYIVGRTPLVLGKVEGFLLPTTADERTKRADSLTVGSFSAPFAFKAAYSLVRLNGRQQARWKSMEEAGADLSSAYQDYASKKLEHDWLQRLRAEFPVVEHKVFLKDAFAKED